VALCVTHFTHKISWLIFCHEFISKSLGYDLSKKPAGSVLNRTRTTEFKKDSCLCDVYWKKEWKSDTLSHHVMPWC